MSLIKSIPIMIQNFKFSQSRRRQFDLIETVSYPGDRSDGEKIKGLDADAGKNEILNHDRYNWVTFVRSF